MNDKIKCTTDGDKFIIQMISNRFTHDLVSHINSCRSYDDFANFNTIEFNLEQVKMIDSSSIGFLFELHNKLKTDNQTKQLILYVGKNQELKDLLHKFQVDMLLTVK